jgi:maltooligosyltrehalose trehalohydrolase
MLFQGQETGTRRRWQFFVDHRAPLVEPIRQGRAKFVAQFQRLATQEAQAWLPDPNAVDTFRASILDETERAEHNPHVRMHRDLLRIRRSTPAFVRGAVETATVSSIIVLRFFGDAPADDRLLLVNSGSTVRRRAMAEPLLAPPATTGWRLAWSSEDPGYGGHGTPPVFTRERFAMPAHAAVLLMPDPDARLLR